MEALVVKTQREAGKLSRTLPRAGQTTQILAVSNAAGSINSFVSCKPLSDQVTKTICTLENWAVKLLPQPSQWLFQNREMLQQ
jgi:hypothetical protein